jgi:LacI family transcriptional regulator
MAKVRLADIARELNLSMASVGCALSDRAGNTRVSSETRRRVREAAQRLNYKLHAGARALRTQQFDNIGYFTAKKSPSDYVHLDRILDGLAEGAAKYRQNIVIVQIPTDAASVDDIPKALRERCLDALIIYDAASFLPGFQAAVEASGIPIIYMNEKQPVDAVYVDDIRTGRIMTSHLIEQGFRRITMLAPTTLRDHYSTSDRITGYREAIDAAGLRPDVRRFASKSFATEVEAWLCDQPRPEAVFCVSDQVAVEFQRVLYRLRLRVPDDIAICGCDGSFHARLFPIPMTTASIPFHAMAVAAFDMAMSRVHNHQSLKSIVLPPSLIAGESTQRQSA